MSSFDVICLGRARLDLIPIEVGVRLEDATVFTKSLGGASAKIAFGCARLGLRTALVARVGDDPAGRFVTRALAAEGCDVSHVAVDRERPTALVLVGTGDDGADSDIDVDERFIAESRVLVVSSGQGSLVLERARRRGVKTVLELDPHRGAASPLDRFDLVVGTQRDIQIAGGSDDLTDALRRIRRLTPATLVVKLGSAGCVVIDADVPAHLEAQGDPGASEAFMAGLLQGWLTGMGWKETSRLASACSALVMARTASAASMPTQAELDHVLSGSRPGADPHLARLHRVTTRRKAWDNLCVLAFDDRTRDFELARDAGAPESRLGPLKELLVRAVSEIEHGGALGALGAVIDDTYGEAALRAASGHGLWLARPVEVPGSAPLEFEGGRSIGSRLATWPREQVVKCLVRFHPDAPVVDRLEDETQLQALYHAVLASGHELVLEVIPPLSLPAPVDTVVRALKRLYNIGIFPDWWGLETLPPDAWREVDELIAARDPFCRGVLLVGEDVSRGFAAARASRSCRGFAAGRTVFHEQSAAWLSGRIDDGALVRAVRAAFAELVLAWQGARKEIP